MRNDIKKSQEALKILSSKLDSNILKTSNAIIKIANNVSAIVNAKIKIIKNSNDPRSYRLDSSKLINLGFKPKKKYVDAILELKQIFLQKKLKDNPKFHSVQWLKNNKNLIK